MCGRSLVGTTRKKNLVECSCLIVLIDWFECRKGEEDKEKSTVCEMGPVVEIVEMVVVVAVVLVVVINHERGHSE